MQIQITYLDSHKKEVHKINGNKCVVGRSLGCDLTISREELSRKHFMIEYEKGDFYITDLNSTNGVMLNGTKIQPGVKTLYQSFYQLDVFGMMLFDIKGDDDVTNPARPAMSASSLSSGEGHRLRKASVKTPERKGNESKKSKNRNLPLALAFVLIVGAAGAAQYLGYLPFDEEEVVTSKPDMSPQDPVDKIRGLDFKSFMSQNQCQQFGSLCSNMGLTGTGEGLGVYGDRFMVFVNLNLHEGEGVNSSFKAMNEETKSELILAQFATNPELKNLLTSQPTARLLVVGFSDFEGILRPRFVLNVDPKNLPNLTPDLHRYVFGEAFYAGNAKLYQRYLKQISKLIPL
jgi:hypothetical protein